MAVSEKDRADLGQLLFNAFEAMLTDGRIELCTDNMDAALEFDHVAALIIASGWQRDAILALEEENRQLRSALSADRIRLAKLEHRRLGGHRETM